jgi:hypothetical protein
MAMARLLDADAPAIESLAGKTFGSYTITRDDIETALRPAFDFIDMLLDMPGVEFYLEHRVTFPTIAGAFGTIDLIVRCGSTIYVIDLKFGSGVLVRAIYPVGDADVLNAQLLFYAAAARHSLPAFFAGVENIILTIVQPQSIEPDAEMVSSVTVTQPTSQGQSLPGPQILRPQLLHVNFGTGPLQLNRAHLMPPGSAVRGRSLRRAAAAIAAWLAPALPAPRYRG